MSFVSVSDNPGKTGSFMGEAFSLAGVEFFCLAGVVFSFTGVDMMNGADEIV